MATPEVVPVSVEVLRVNVERALKGIYVPTATIDQLLSEIRDSVWVAMIQDAAQAEVAKRIRQDAVDEAIDGRLSLTAVISIANRAAGR
jgi:hypothetical protein